MVKKPKCMQDTATSKEGIVASDDLFEELKYKYDLPDNATELTLKLSAMSLVRVDYKYYNGSELVDGKGALYYKEDMYEVIKEACVYLAEKPLKYLMAFDPTTGEQYPYPSSAKQYREYHGKVAWLYNPYTGVPRSALDIGSDTFGYLITD